MALGKAKSELAAAVNAVAQTEKKLAQARTELATADKAAAPLRGQHDSISKEITAQDKARAEKMAAPAALAAEFVTKSKPVTDAIAQLKAAQPALDKAFTDARAKLEGEIKIVDAKKAEVTKATEELENTKKKKATAETTIAASLKDNPVRDKNLVEINAELTKLQPQLDPLRAKVKQLESQYFTMLPK